MCWPRRADMCMRLAKSRYFRRAGHQQRSTDAGQQDGMVALREALDKIPAGLIFANLIDFDMLYGRNDPQGYARALQEFDGFLPELLQTLTPRELLMIVADHGCDPTTEYRSFREYVPLLAAWTRWLWLQGWPGGPGDTGEPGRCGCHFRRIVWTTSWSSSRQKCAAELRGALCWR